MAFFGFLRRILGIDSQVAHCYRRLVSQSRDPWFYAHIGVPDSFEGRFECLVLHLSILYYAMETPSYLHPVRQKLTELFVASMDDDMREIGVSDSGIARKMTKMAEHLFGRIKAYGAIRSGDEEALCDAIVTNMALVDNRAAAELSAYTIAAFRAMDALDAAEKRRDLIWCAWQSPARPQMKE